MKEQLFVIQVNHIVTGWQNAFSPRGGLASFTDRDEANADAVRFSEMGYDVRVKEFEAKP